MKNKKCNLTIFTIGALGYAIIELLWRGRTHWSMMLAGGISFLGLSKISDTFKYKSLFFKALVGCGFITGIEFIFGIIFNIMLKRKVWDYSRMPLNIGGQICAVYTFFWFVLSLIFIPLTDNIKNKTR